MKNEAAAGLIFGVFTEIGIIGQLSRALLEARLPDGLIQPHFSVLNHLERVGDGQTPMDMARAFQVPKTSMAHTVKVLTARGLIELRANADDGRSKRVWITNAGRKLRQDVIAQLEADFVPLAQSFGPERFAEMRPHLQALRELLDANRDVQNRK